MSNTLAQIQADIQWKDQLHEIFASSPYNKQLRDEFWRIYKHLKSQDVSVTSFPDYSDPTLMQWLLTRNDEEGRLILLRRGNQWEMHGFKFVDEQGNLIPEFESIRCPTKRLANSGRLEGMKADFEAYKRDKKQRPTAREAYHNLGMSCPLVSQASESKELLTEFLSYSSVSIEKREELKQLAVQIEKETKKLRKSLDRINKLLYTE